MNEPHIDKPQSFLLWVRQALRQDGAAKAALAIVLCAAAWSGFYQACYFPVWAPIDEAAHFSFIQTIAKKGRLPILGQDYVEDEILAVARRVYPAKSGRDPKNEGVGGLSYEAFQPPLFYLAAVPVYALSGPNTLVKVVWLRMFCWSVFLSSFLFVYLILRDQLRQRWPYGALLASAFYVFPSVVVRNTTISNCCLEAPLIGLFLYATLFPPKQWGWRKYIIGSAALGLLLLTKLTTLYLGALQGAVIVRELLSKAHPLPLRIRRVAVLCGVPAAFLGCWILRNLLVHGQPTANAIMMQMIAPIVNPQGLRIGLPQILNILTLFPYPVPEEWASRVLPLLTWQMGLLTPIIVWIPLVIGNMRAALAREWRLVVLLCLPVAATGFLVVATLSQNWQAVYARYIFSCLPFYGAGMGIAATRWAGRIGALVLAAVAFTVLIAIWALIGPAI